MSYSATRRKRFTAGVLAGAMALTVMPILGFTGTAGAEHVATPTGEGNVCEDAPEQEPFTDVTEADPSVEEIECLFNTGITVGVTATTYEPNSPVQRRQMALFLARLADTLEENEIDDEITALPAGNGDTPFTDLDDEEQEVKVAVDRLEQVGITEGVTATEFRPGVSVTRRQMAKFLVRLQDYASGDDDITPTPTEDYFDDDNGDTGEDELNILAEEGVFVGDEQGNVNPGDDISRRQMANVLTRKLQVFFEAGDITQLFANAPAPFAVAVDTDDVTVAPGADLPATFTGDLDEVESITVAGDCVEDGDVTLDDGTAAITISADAADGECELTFTVTFTDGTTQTLTRTVTVAVEGNATVTDRPELVSANIFQTNQSGPNVGTVVRYVFDENVTGRAPTALLFFAYEFDGTRYIGETANIDTDDNTAVFVRFDEITTAAGAADLRVATVEFGAVADDTFATLNTESFNPIGDAVLNPGTTTGGTPVTFQAGRTDGPDLLTVGNFRGDPLDGTNSLVDFTFDEAATVTNLGGFHLVLKDGITDIVGVVQSGSGTTVVTVNFPEGSSGNLTSTNVARGYVEAGTVSDDADDVTIVAITDPAQGNLNPLQAADAVTDDSNSDTPDLVSATFNEAATATSGGAPVDAVTYTFDEAVTVADISTGALFGIYRADGSVVTGTPGTALRSTTTNNQVRVEFPNDTLFSAVGAFVEEGAVQEDTATTVTSRPNQEDEVGVANSNTDTTGGTSTERTAGPDLTGVAINPVTDVFGTVTGFTATYTFDETVASVTDPTAFHLFLGDGTRLTSTACTADDITTSTGTTDANTVTCTGFDGTTNQPNQAVLGTVEFDAVVATDLGPSNPEGAELTQGATNASPQQ